MKDRFTKYFLPEYISHVYSGVPGVQVHTHVSRQTSNAFPLWYMKGNRVSLSLIFYVLLCWVEEELLLINISLQLSADTTLGKENSL